MAAPAWACDPGGSDVLLSWNVTAKAPSVLRPARRMRHVLRDPLAGHAEADGDPPAARPSRTSQTPTTERSRSPRTARPNGLASPAASRGR